jgi:uncharacterized protein
VPARRPYVATAAFAGLAIVCGFAAINTRSLRPAAPAPRIEISPSQLWADGYDVALLTIAAPYDARPRVSIQGNPHIATIAPAERHGGKWIAEIHAGVLPGSVQIRVESASLALTTSMPTRDSRSDGTPDFLRLDSLEARAAFRRWFTFLAEAQYFQLPESRPAEISDCAALIRYAYREALRAHDSAWATAAHLPLIPAFDSPGKYEYPFTPLGAALFRISPGPFRASDIASGAFAQFADAKTLWRFNTHLASRDLNRAQPADILFYRQLHPDSPDTFHSMIYLGASQIHPDSSSYVLYHTGPQDDSPGEMRRLTLDQLRRFPEPEWRPESENPRFLGVYRWNILSSTEFNP